MATDHRDLETMDRASLIALWAELFGRPPPKRLSRPFLRRCLAFELQARRYGGLSKRAKAALTGGLASRRPVPSSTLKPGTRLLREWNGVTHVVDVGEDGVSWKGRHYGSLSAVAREITGAHWSGPRFFGLNGRAGR